MRLLNNWYPYLVLIPVPVPRYGHVGVVPTEQDGGGESRSCPTFLYFLAACRMVDDCNLKYT